MENQEFQEQTLKALDGISKLMEIVAEILAEMTKSLKNLELIEEPDKEEISGDCNGCGEDHDPHECLNIH